ncbi:uncharacterized protein EI90DRAFT_161700 [Cantharellus anzutake]|uniref:uncharacterized protein n=1 Tax=Cantharellus anzutake TaxID=1750568 RepID=UPI001905FFCB|nr:uncharacterized protein EI90DRAFT_161700 [Cantharellus anzutake]KAF8336336.1 hypothetical protein EI90DRAFT_161700 [Cantharellus anzutake]
MSSSCSSCSRRRIRQGEQYKLPSLIVNLVIDLASLCIFRLLPGLCSLTLFASCSPFLQRYHLAYPSPRSALIYRVARKRLRRLLHGVIATPFFRYLRKHLWLTSDI